MHATTLFSSLALFSTALALPLTTRSESWTVPNLDLHFMGSNSGLPGGTWPDSSKFNSTIDFTVAFPSGSVACSGNWIYQQIPTTPFTCAPGVTFQLSPTAAGVLNEATFTLTVKKTVSGTTLVGSHEVTNNSPGQPNSYLTCLGGAPLDGIRCHESGFASTAGTLVLVAA